MKNKNSVLVTGTLILTAAGILSRVLGFYNRIFLSQFIGAKEMGIFQLIFPVYVLSFAICCQGIQTAVSRMVASYSAYRNKRTLSHILLLATTLSLILSLIVSLAMYLGSDFISLYILKEESTSLCLKIASFAVPFVAVKSCYIGYEYGLKHSVIPATAQLFEQVIRVGSIYLIAMFCYQNRTAEASVAVIGMVLGEMASCIYTVMGHRISHSKELVNTASPIRKRTLASVLIHDSIPLTSNRLALTILQSAEAILLPASFALYYGSRDLSLEIYGILNGMALPFLYFPSAITNSLSVMVMPEIASAKAQGQHVSIERTISKSIHYCMIVGIASTFLFLFYGKQLGSTIFHNDMAGEFMLMLAFLCPFTYVTSALNSILNGLGRVKKTLIHNIVSLLIRIGFILFAVPVFGVKGYLWAMLLSDLALILLHTLAILKETIIHFNTYDFIVKPVILSIISGGVSLLFAATSHTGVWALLTQCLLFLFTYFVGCTLTMDLFDRKKA